MGVPDLLKRPPRSSATIFPTEVKRRASHMHTFCEIVYARYGMVPHVVMVCFALLANLIVTRCGPGG